MLPAMWWDSAQNILDNATAQEPAPGTITPTGYMQNFSSLYPRQTSVPSTLGYASPVPALNVLPTADNLPYEPVVGPGVPILAQREDQFALTGTALPSDTTQGNAATMETKAKSNQFVWLAVGAVVLFLVFFKK